MQAISSPIVTPVSNAVANSAFLADLSVEAPEGYTYVYAKTRAIKPRADILARRRKRHARRTIR